MATLIAGQDATPGEPGTRAAAGGDEGFPGRRSPARRSTGLEPRDGAASSPTAASLSAGRIADER